MPAKLALADRLCADVSALTPVDLTASTADIMQIASIWQDPALAPRLLTLLLEE